MTRGDRFIRDAVDHASAAANRSGQRQWAAVRMAEAAGSETPYLDALDRFHWSRPTSGIAIAASGCAHAIEVKGSARFRDAATQAREVFARLHTAGDEAPTQAGPVLVGGFAFGDDDPRCGVWRDFPAGRLVLPRQLRVRMPRSAWRIAAIPVDRGDPPALRRDALRKEIEATARASLHTQAGSDRAPHFEARAERPLSEYAVLAAEAVRAIAKGDLEKVVLARRVELRCEGAFDVPSLLESLRASHPSCTTFAVGRGDASFVGATPERLLRLFEDRVETAALAGSAPRGHTPQEDAAFRRELVESKKEQEEHAVVVRAMRDALEPWCRVLHAPEAPSPLRLEGIQHLETRIEGTLANGAHLLEIAETLHPTPAVGGAPRAAALEWLARHEPFDRGWYAGAVGFVDAAGGGELAVGLRSGVLRGGEAHLYAGAGIVAGSRPQAELLETRIKLRALLAPLLEI